MIYKVLEEFSDMLDGGRIYKAGDFYPRAGYTPTESRVKALGSTANALGRKLIAFEAPKAVETPTIDVAEEAPQPQKASRKRTKK